MLDGKAISKAIRMKKKNLLKPELDSAGQEALDPSTADDIEQNERISATLGNPDHPAPSASMMGEDESSQDEATRKKVSARIAKYFESL